VEERDNTGTQIIFGFTAFTNSLNKDLIMLEQSRYSLAQLISAHANDLQNPIARCYLLLQRPLGTGQNPGAHYLNALRHRRLECSSHIGSTVATGLWVGDGSEACASSFGKSKIDIFSQRLAARR
jgi:hypothetical protein